MKSIIGVLLFGLLGFLGCSDGDDGTLAVGEANPVAPFGIIEIPAPTYEWTPVQRATKYRLLVQDANETVVIDEWYTAEESGCASEDGLCMVTPDTEVIGENAWKVQAVANNQYGVWSEPLNFDFTAMDVPRFTDHGDGTVTDNKTGLMWDINANRFGAVTGDSEYTVCADSQHSGGRWQPPGIAQLRSLVDRDQWNPALPPGHPFINVQCGGTPYWTWWHMGEPHPPPGGGWWVVNFNDGAVGYVGPQQTGRAWLWCLRFIPPPETGKQ